MSADPLIKAGSIPSHSNYAVRISTTGADCMPCTHFMLLYGIITKISRWQYKNII